MQRRGTTLNRRIPELGLWQLAKIWLASIFRSVDGTQLPGDGRSSQETVNGLAGPLAAVGSVLPPFELEVYRILKKLWMENPDFSQFVSNAESLGNTGHTLTVDAANDSQAEAALKRLNESASRIYANGAGVDGLINAYLDQLAWSGALSSEDVVDFARRRVDQVVIVPIEEIRFRYIDGRYVPHQQPRTLFNARGSSVLGLIPLNENTYHYYATQTIENSPYAKPPAMAAIEMICEVQKPAVDNIKHIVQKLGILGLVAFLVTKPKIEPGESSSEYKKRVEAHLMALTKKLDGNFNKGLLVGLKGEHQIDHANVASDGRGATEIFRVIEELVFSGMGSMAAFHGRNHTTTETFADVIYSMQSAQVVNRQRLVKRRQEQTYRLDLLLAGLAVDSLSLNFNPVEARNNVEKAQAEQTRQETVLDRARAGIISPDDAAQELGYEAAFDPELLSGLSGVAKNAGAGLRAKAHGLSATFRFDRATQRYRFKSSAIEIASRPVEAADSDRVVEFKKKSSIVELRKLTEEEIDALLDYFIARYLRAVQPIAREAREVALQRIRSFLRNVDTDHFRGADDFADSVIDEIQTAYQGSFKTPRAEAVVRRATKDSYEFYRLRDQSPFGNAEAPRLEFGGPDRRAVKFFNELDGFYFSTFINNRRPELETFLREEYLEKGAALFGRDTGESINDFRVAVGGKLDNLNDYAVRTIITSSVQRIRNYAHINALRNGLFKWAKIVAIRDARTSPICRFMDGKFIRVKVAASTVDRFTKMEPGEYALALYKSDLGRAYAADSVGYVKDRIGSNGVIEDSLIAEGRGFPPYHPNCRSRAEGLDAAVGDELPKEE